MTVSPHSLFLPKLISLRPVDLLESPLVIRYNFRISSFFIYSYFCLRKGNEIIYHLCYMLEADHFFFCWVARRSATHLQECQDPGNDRGTSDCMVPNIGLSHQLKFWHVSERKPDVGCWGWSYSHFKCSLQWYYLDWDNQWYLLSPGTNIDSLNEATYFQIHISYVWYPPALCTCYILNFCNILSQIAQWTYVIGEFVKDV